MEKSTPEIEKGTKQECHLQSNHLRAAARKRGKWLGFSFFLAEARALQPQGD